MDFNSLVLFQFNLLNNYYLLAANIFNFYPDCLCSRSKFELESEWNFVVVVVFAKLFLNVEFSRSYKLGNFLLIFVSIHYKCFSTKRMEQKYDDIPRRIWMRAITILRKWNNVSTLNSSSWMSNIKRSWSKTKQNAKNRIDINWIIDMSWSHHS